MNETIGKKGGANDHRRALRIKLIQKEKLQEHQEKKEIRDLEAKLRKQKRYILIRSLPIIVAGGVIRSFYTTLAYKKERENEEDNFVILPDEAKEDEVEEFTIPKKKKDIVVVIAERPAAVELSTSKAKKKKRKRLPKKKEHKEEPIVKEESDTSIKEDYPKLEVKEEIESGRVGVVTGEEVKTPPPIIPIQSTISSVVPPVIPVLPINQSEIGTPSPAVEMLEPFKSEEIINHYEKRFKDIRYELRKILFEYYVIEKEEGKVSNSMQADVLLERLNVVIRKLEELKEQLSKMNQMNDMEIYQFINNCLIDFQEEDTEVKDSPFYLSIAEKVDEIDQKKERLKKKVEEKKKVFVTQEQNFDQMKKKYEKFEEFQQILSDLQETQKELLKEIQEKVENAVNVEKKVEIKLKYLNDQSSRILRILSLSMMIPGFYSAKGFTLATFAYLNFMHQLLHPQLEKTEYEVIQVEDYTDMIEDSIHSIESVQKDISGVRDQLEKTIKEVEEQFQDYAGIFPDFRQFLFNLNKIKSNLEEKEYEMEKIKSENGKELEKNKAKILERVEKPL